MVHVEMLIDKGIDAIMRMTGIRATTILLWCGLLAHNKSLTLEQTADLVEVYCVEHGGWEAGRDMLNVIITGAIAESNFLGAQGTENQQK
jgi:hypothetical protein